MFCLRKSLQLQLQSAVSGKLTGNINTINNLGKFHSVISVLFYSSVNKTSKMSSWKDAKEKFLNMPVEEKRKLYKSEEFKTLEDIPTWKEYANSNSLAPKLKKYSACDIDESLSMELVDKVSLFMGDITTLEIDCIVNAANNTLLGGGGVDGAIHNAAGPDLREECRTLKGCETGSAKVTGGYKLPAKFIIHTVGPKGEKPALLINCYKDCLAKMNAKKLRTIAFPSISTGVYGYPIEPATLIAIYETRKFLEKYRDDVERIIFCVFSEEDKNVYEGLLQCYFPME